MPSSQSRQPRPDRRPVDLEGEFAGAIGITVDIITVDIQDIDIQDRRKPRISDRGAAKSAKSAKSAKACMLHEIVRLPNW